MSKWEQDDFMSEWDKKYVSTNVRSGSRAYEPDLFLGLNKDLASQPELQHISHAIIVCTKTPFQSSFGRGTLDEFNTDSGLIFS